MFRKRFESFILNISANNNRNGPEIEPWGTPQEMEGLNNSRVTSYNIAWKGQLFSTASTTITTRLTCLPSPNITSTKSEHVKQAKAFSHFIPHLHSCRFSSPVLSWTIAMLNLGVGPWTGEATRQEVETWVSCCKSIVFMSVVAVFLSCYVTLFFVIHPALASQICVSDTVGCVPWGDLK